MKKYLFGGILLLLLICAFIAGSWLEKRASARNAGRSERRILFYVDPMNPAHTSEKPGVAPCGMNMEPVYADDATAAQPPGGASSPPAPGTVKVSAEKQQVIGVQTAIVEKAAMHRVMRTVGSVAADESRIYRLNSAVDGWVREISNNLTGSLVNKGDKLASYYAPEFLSAEQAYIFALGSLDRFQAGGKETPAQIEQTRINVQQYIDSLRNLGMSDLQIREIARTRKFTENINIVAPAKGFIIARNVSVGQRFEKGTEWYRIADLSRVWVLADCFRNETQYIKPGMKVRITVPHQKQELQALVSNALPQFDATSRTLKVRLEMENPGYLLKPGMFVDVEFPVQLPASITVPVDAVVDSGLKKTVFVDRGNGFFEPRQVETGWRSGGKTEITRGLMAGDRIVVSGTFLIDSESRMKTAAAAMQAQAQPAEMTKRARDPVCGMEIDAAEAGKAGRMSGYHGVTYYFCADQCLTSFRKKPEQFIK